MFLLCTSDINPRTSHHVIPTSSPFIRCTTSLVSQDSCIEPRMVVIRTCSHGTMLTSISNFEECLQDEKVLQEPRDEDDLVRSPKGCRHGSPFAILPNHFLYVEVLPELLKRCKSICNIAANAYKVQPSPRSGSAPGIPNVFI